MKNAIRGVLPVVHMPYNQDLSIDWGALEVEVDWLFETGAHGLCLALVSDLLRLSAEERLELPARLVKFARGRGPVIISAGAESTLQARIFARAAQAGGAAAVMAIPPLSRALSEAQLQAYFEGLLEAIEIPLIVQDASSYVGRAMSIEVQVPQILRKHTGGAKSLKASGRTVREVLEDLDRQHPGLRERILEDGGRLHRFVNIYVNDEDVRFIQALDTPLKDGDVVSILPAVAGGRA